MGFFFGVRRLFGIAVCLGWAGVRLPSKGRLKETVAAPVVPCGCCVVGLAPAHTAAVWLSVWAAGITGRPFTPAQTAVCSPSPSTLVHSASSPLHHFFFCLYILCLSTLCSLYARMLSATLYPFYPQCVCLCFCLSLSSSLPSFVFYCLQLSLLSQLTQKDKRKQQQLGAVTVLLWNPIAFSVKDEVVNNELHITTKSLQ